MSASFSKYLWLNLILLMTCLASLVIAFILYSSYIIQNIALHDVYYNLSLYISTYHFLLISLFSVGFFLLPFLNIFSRTFNHKRLVFICIVLQFASIVVLYFKFNFISLTASIIAMSLTNIIFIIISLNLWSLAPHRYRFLVITTTYALNTTLLTSFLKWTYNNHYYTIEQYFLLLCLGFITLAAVLLFLSKMQAQKRSSFHSFTDHLFINVFHLMRHAKMLLVLIIISITITLTSILLDKIKLLYFLNHIEYFNFMLLIKITPINLVLTIAICYIARSKNTKIQISIVLLIFLFLSSTCLLIIHHDSTGIEINFTYQVLLIIDRTVTFVTYSFILGACIDHLLCKFKKSQVFVSSVFYISTGISVWIILQALNAIF
ncbi:hypothetical protein [Fastidiosibacter lacustris]|uniref:hypothetical protein n=1 Tax=Fastidiosibacter lacustris TaxID=2056695 RepID=UPI000E3551C7|nr:hypothetical protein [Fastidiosibacter lacustris]